MRLLSRLALVLSGLLLAFGLGEWVVRQQIPVDETGQRWQGATRLPPWQFPMQQIRDRLAAIDRGESLFLIDSDLGWRPRPGASSRDGKIHIDAAGIRSNGNPPRAPAVLNATGRTLRIVTVGDSFTFGDEVPDVATWPAQLERLLRQSGVPARVFNLGTNAYGIDQAILRLARDGPALKPDVVILGLQPENLMRNVNVLRPVFFPDTSLPLSKPRFVLHDGKLELRNQPTLPADEILEFLEAPENHPLASDEAWLDERYEEAFWQQSVLLNLLAQRMNTAGLAGMLGEDADVEQNTARRRTEMIQLGTALLQKFRQEAERLGARPLLVYLPRRAELESELAGEELWYSPWLAAAAEHGDGFPLVRPEANMTVVTDELFAPAGHYSARQNRRVAEAILLALQPRLRNFRDAARADAARPVATPAPLP